MIKNVFLKKNANLFLARSGMAKKSWSAAPPKENINMNSHAANLVPGRGGIGQLKKKLKSKKNDINASK